LIVPANRLDEERDILERLKNGERIEHFDTVRMRKDGSEIEVSLTVSPVRDDAGRVIGASNTARDISERKRVERALKELADTLETKVQFRTAELWRRNQELHEQSKRLRELSRQLLETQDQERRHIARELHDSAGQTLAAIAMNLAQMVRKTEKSAPDIAAQAAETEQLARHLTREIRTTSYLLHPPLLDEAGLVPALSCYIDGLQTRSQLDVALSVPKDLGRLPEALELVIFRVVQECLTNVYRHSGSKTAAIRIDAQPEGVFVEIEDQGKGMSPELLTEMQTDGAGVGLRGIRERVRHLNGEVTIESSAAGTTVRATLPTTTKSRPGNDYGHRTPHITV
jgi:signal transduction histidine kinase